MSKIFEYIGLISLMCFSFIITEETTTIAKNVDEIMINIKNNYKEYEKKPIDAIIDNKKIIAGNCGKDIDIDKSYLEMKKIGMYDEALYQYKNVYPSINLKNNYDKYIVGGNYQKNTIYIFIAINEENKYWLNSYDFDNYNFIVSKSFYMNNMNLIKELVGKHNSVLIEETNYKDYKNILNHYKKLTKQNIYCYNDSIDSIFMNICSSNRSNTIGKIELYSSNYLYSLKSNLKRGSFYKFTLNKELISNSKSIDNYLNQKGIKKSNIDETLKEC